MIGIFIMFLSFIVLMVASMWVIYEKAGKPGWTSTVPIYNYFIFLEIIGKPWWWFLLSVVPIVNIIFLIWGFNLLSKSFGKTEGFTVGLLFIPVIFVPILAFGEDVEYKGPAGEGSISSTPREKALYQTAESEKALSPETFEQLRIEQKLIRMEQKLMTGIVSGFVAGIIVAVLWGLFTVLAEGQIGFMAVALGAIVGLTIREFGNGVDSIFGIWGAGISLFSILLGNFLSIIFMVADLEELGYIDALLEFDYSLLFILMGEYFGAIDLLFYAIAMYEGYKFSFRSSTE